MSRTYATPEQYATWLGESTPPDGAAHLLRDASLDVDDMLLTAHYRVDEAGMPVDQVVRDALRDATCAQATHRGEYGDDVELSAPQESISLGPLSLGGGRGSSGTGSGVPQYSPRAWRILRSEGLIPGGVTDG